MACNRLNAAFFSSESIFAASIASRRKAMVWS